MAPPPLIAAYTSTFCGSTMCLTIGRSGRSKIWGAGERGEGGWTTPGRWNRRESRLDPDEWSRSER